MRILKRLLDVVAATLGLIVLAPVMLLVALAVRVAIGSPVIFRQIRPGLRAEPFLLFKFRTMRSASGSDGRPLADAARLTRLGKFLRATSLDELPQLFNVLRGEMSLIGPRPLLVEYLPLYSPEQSRRHEVLPGITGWAQIHGRNSVSWPEKFRLDVWYVDHWNFWLDLKILARTVVFVLGRKGVNQPGCATFEPFRGNGPKLSDQPRAIEEIELSVRPQRKAA